MFSSSMRKKNPTTSVIYLLKCNIPNIELIDEKNKRDVYVRIIILMTEEKQRKKESEREREMNKYLLMKTVIGEKTMSSSSSRSQWNH